MSLILSNIQKNSLFIFSSCTDPTILTSLDYWSRLIGGIEYALATSAAPQLCSNLPGVLRTLIVLPTQLNLDYLHF